MKKILIIFLLFISITGFSNTNNAIGYISNRAYHSKIMGFTFLIPKGWHYKLAFPKKESSVDENSARPQTQQTLTAIVPNSSENFQMIIIVIAKLPHYMNFLRSEWKEKFFESSLLSTKKYYKPQKMQPLYINKRKFIQAGAGVAHLLKKTKKTIHINTLTLISVQHNYIVSINAVSPTLSYKQLDALLKKTLQVDRK